MHSKLNPSKGTLTRSVKLKLLFKENLKSEFYPSNQEGHKLYQHFKRRATFEITHPYKFVNMFKFLFYKVQLIFQNIGNLINYNHSLTHVMHSLPSCARWPCDSNYQVTWGCNLKCDNVSTTTTITKNNNY